MSRFSMISFGRTETGRVRTKNEDAFLINAQAGIYCVADGLGGHPGGEVASELAINFFEREILRKQKKIFGKKWQKSQLVTIFDTINKNIIDHSLEKPALRGMGTTFSGLVFESKSQGWVFHAGDSRIYTYSIQDEFEQITMDHTVAMDQVRSGHISETNAVAHPFWHVLTSCLGSEEFTSQIIPIDYGNFRSFLLCTDGLTNMLNFEEILFQVKENWMSAEYLCNRLVDLALHRGGKDNITVIVVSRGGLVS